jgi:hypothetical protein
MPLNTVYTCGRMHKPRKLKLCNPNANAKAVANAIYKIMLEELGDEARKRWCSRLNAELGCATFKQEGLAAEIKAAPVPRVWVPSKPEITLAFLDEFERASKAITDDSSQVRVGSDSSISKLLTKHAVERLRQDKGVGWLEACGELTVAQMNDPVKLTHALSRVAFDLLVYVHARAVELKRDNEMDVVLELHSSDQTLMGRAMRGCGVVVCEKGRATFARAVALVRDTMVARKGS